MKDSSHAQSNVHNDSTQMVGLFCLAHCFVELVYDSNLGISSNFRFFLFISVLANFLTAYLACDNSIPSKIYHCIIGFCLYSAYSVTILLLGRASIPELVHDLMLC